MTASSRIHSRSNTNLVNNTIGSAGSQNHPSSYFRRGIFPVHKISKTSSNLPEHQTRNLSAMGPPKNQGEGGDNNDPVNALLDDNPCWGSHTRNRLEDLLSIIDRNSSIIYDSPQYLVLNKPPDLRMDGQYASTVHKLLTYWYPPPSLSSLGKSEPKLEASIQSETKVEDDEVDEKDSCHNNNARLLEAVSRLHQYNNVRDNFLRPCHQLDYATSGVLLVAKTHEAASHIGRLFEERHEGVQKSYTAVVVGDLRKALLCNSSKENESEPSHKTGLKVPIWTGGTTVCEVREQMQRLEEIYRRKRAAKGKQHCRVRDASKDVDTKKKKKASITGGTFEGFQPAHSLFSKWKSKMKSYVESSADGIEDSPQLKKRQKRRKFNKNSASALLTDDDWQRIWDPVNEIVQATSTAEIDFEKLEWKKLQNEHIALKKAMIRAADIHNDILRNAIREKEQKQQEEADKATNNGKELPILFRLPEDSEKADSVDNDSTFYVCCPLAQHPDQFNMVVPAGIVQAYPHLSTPRGSNTNCNTENDTIDNENSQLKFRPSLTKCTILECGKLCIVRNQSETKIDVTKVRLYPMTGRRHQLRVHMALTGFPILGDVAYGGDRSADHNQGQSNGGEEQKMEFDVCSRMCLHAQFLQLPTLLGESNPNWKITTSDPFVFGSDGKLMLNQGK